MIRETYNYIWNVLIKSKNEKIDTKSIKFKASKKVSPYLELNLEDINFNDLEMEDNKYIIDVNPYIRFTDTFIHLLNLDYKKAVKFRESITNIFLHLMGNLDLYEGRSNREYHLEFIIEDIEKGVFGVEVKELFEYFLDFEKYRIAEVLYDLYSFENRMEAYKRAIKKIFEDSIIYDNNFSEEILVIYINKQEITENIKKLECINFLFLPLWLDIRVFWAYHFGIVGVPITMKIGNIAIY